MKTAHPPHRVTRGRLELLLARGERAICKKPHQLGTPCKLMRGPQAEHAAEVHRISLAGGRGVVWCWKCGCCATIKPKRLAEECGELTPFGRATLRRIREGNPPYHIAPSWPNTDDSLFSKLIVKAPIAVAQLREGARPAGRITPIATAANTRNAGPYRNADHNACAQVSPTGDAPPKA